jgi:hypothetical protein
VIGTLQATELLKELLGLGNGLVGRLLVWDALAARFEEIRYGWDADNPLNGTQPKIKDLSHLSAPAGPACGLEDAAE